MSYAAVAARCFPRRPILVNRSIHRQRVTPIHRPWIRLSSTANDHKAQPLAKSETRSKPKFIRFLPTSFQPDEESSSSLGRIARLALTEKKPLSIAVGFVSPDVLSSHIVYNTKIYYAATCFIVCVDVCPIHNWSADWLLHVPISGNGPNYFTVSNSWFIGTILRSFTSRRCGRISGHICYWWFSKFWPVTLNAPRWAANYRKTKKRHILECSQTRG